MRRLLVCALVLLLSPAALSQTLNKRPTSQNPVTPKDITERLEQSAIRTGQSTPKAARGSSIDFAWPSSAGEYRALGKRVLVLVSVVTQDAAELPLRRVYINVGGKETELMRLSSQLSNVAKETKTFSIFGPYREDGFYLAPAALMVADGYLQADFAVRRNNFNLYKLPGTPPEFLTIDSDPMLPPAPQPDMAAVRAMLLREYKGFELPAGLR